MVFEGMDKDHDGSLSLQEVVETYRRVQARRPPAPTTRLHDANLACVFGRYRDSVSQAD
jgi:hypothetical protein